MWSIIWSQSTPFCSDALVSPPNLYPPRFVGCPFPKLAVGSLPHEKADNDHNNNRSYYINTNEIPGELSRENMISSHLKITCYFHMWKYHRCYGYIINRAFRRKKPFHWNGLVFHWCFQHSKRNFVSPRGHVIFSIYLVIFKCTLAT